MTHGQRFHDTCGEEDATTARGDHRLCGPCAGGARAAAPSETDGQGQNGGPP